MARVQKEKSRASYYARHKAERIVICVAIILVVASFLFPPFGYTRITIKRLSAEGEEMGTTLPRSGDTETMLPKSKGLETTE